MTRATDPSDAFASKPLLWGKHCRGPGCDDFNERRPSCVCSCAACMPPLPAALDERVVAKLVVKEMRALLSCAACDGAGFGYLGICDACHGSGHVRDQVKRPTERLLALSRRVRELQSAAGAAKE